MAVSNTVNIQAMTSGLSDSLSDVIGITVVGISHFCGQYSFKLTSPIATVPAVLPSIVTLCSSDCGSYNNYTLASISPINNDLLGFVPFSLDIDFKNQAAGIKITNV